MSDKNSLADRMRNFIIYLWNRQYQRYTKTPENTR